MNHRLFLGIPFPKELESELTTVRNSIKTKMHWIPGEKLHLTLNFIGKTPDEKLPELQKQIASCISVLPAFKIHFGFVQTVYSRHDGSFVCLTPDLQSEHLFELQSKLRDLIYNLDYPVADRFWPHITVAKVPKNDPVSTKSILDQINSLDLHLSFELVANFVVLFESRSDRTGTHYSRLATYPLSTSILE